MTLGELFDKLQNVREAMNDVADAERSIGFGGNADTMKGKREVLEMRERWLESLRNEPIQL